LVKKWWLAVLAGALIFLAADSARQLAAFRAVTALGEKGRSAPVPDPGSPTGYQDGRRSQILQSTDGYHWVMQTQLMIASGDWRVRRVTYDNAPDGREVHWCSPLHWWLAAVAWADHVVTGRSWLVAVEHAALYAGPVLLGLFLLAVVPWTARRFGAWPAALLAAGLVAVVPFSGEYGTGSFDHHGVAASCALLTVLFLGAGWISPPAPARRAFIASGIAGAAGLWVNAASLIPVLAGIGAGALLAQQLGRGGQSATADPRRWRTWGLAGGIASLLFYLVEYFPGHLGWRLEVNHPLYALAWAGAGDLLAR
jgi:asparagine N-glycosylation enzyme membrane subunit Stt3